MKGYIYQIINKVDGKRYVGQTIDIERRKKQHFTKLQNNTHPNTKLQQAWNEWGQESFYFDYEEFEDSSILDKKEIETIEKFDSFKNGYNMTPGGQNGGTRSKLNYSEYCFVYYGCQWQGMTEKIGKYLNVDSACISSILREKSYKNYLEMSKELTQTEISKIQNHFREVFNIPEDKLPDSQRVPSHLTEEEYLYCFCITSSYGRGIEALLGRYFDKHKSFLSNGAKSKKGIVASALGQYQKFSDEEILKIGIEKFSEWELDKYSNRKINQEFHARWRK